MKQFLRKNNIYKQLRQLYYNYKAYNFWQKNTNVRIHNFLLHPAPQDYWLQEFIVYRNLLQNSNKKISIFSVFGSKEMIHLNRDDIKIFIARENIHREQWTDYADNCLDVSSINLSLGYDYVDSERYMRFPLWIMWLFPPTVDYEYIKEWCDRINHPNNSSFDNRKFCAFLCSHDDVGRREVYEQLSSIDRVDCDGRLFHNNDELKQIYSDDKLRYLQHYRFNLCPENSQAHGYVTEKLFEAIASGCIPIYCGNEGCPPESDILNSDAILFVDMSGDNTKTLKQVSELNSNKEAYAQFAMRPRLKPDAAERIWSYIQELNQRLIALIEA